MPFLPVCRDMTELATDYMEGAMPLGRRLKVRAHLALCEMCRRYYAQLRETIGLLRRLPPAPVPPSLEEQVMTRASLDGSGPERPAPS